jgi:hypothetical protein
MTWSVTHTRLGFLKKRSFMNPEDGAQFEVTGYFYLSARGALLIGQFLSGKIPIAMQIPIKHDIDS